MKKSEIRELEVLKSLVEDFILTKEAVASKVICEDYITDISSATIRNDLARLEKKGYIYQPHTSAGRIPTTMGFRKYLDLISSEVDKASYDKTDILQSMLIQNYRDIPLSLYYIKQLLAKETDQLSFVAEPEISYDCLSKLDVFKIGKNKLLFVLSLDSGMDKTIIIKTDYDISEDQLKVLVRYLNDELTGLRIYDIINKYLDEISDIITEDNKLLRYFLKEFHNALIDLNSFYIHFDGSIEFLNQTEFDNKNNILIFLEMMQRHDILVSLMQKNLVSEDYNVIMGEAFSNPEWSGLSMIYSRYEIFGIPAYLGVIGPVAMNYKKNLPIVRDIAKLITETTKRGMMVVRNEEKDKYKG
ncbi:MAG: heat-inducible transcriptional repressor HrcA [Candidatus Cloacimonadales bacterium]|nr:heat-inducible transcriptional repressor HrcA [Candidatus Cloacimonadota bacterium]MDD2650444.1 heat-inducible transcriptional repressor HrcA [Candidatus Cloacimonadota bacterium]MDD3501680.1 heat-inducible transcriptional repressor HrcA [Candidatus Cloacimonadota bacterium]MDX9977352.1 heat-inducible transcriptional repressor HrcA [Candidatus Cloacimonadales bacterium]